jgi:predicted O-methyltransferase YrrM
LSTILPKLFAIFREAGHEPLTGYSISHFPKWPAAPFTVFLKHGKPVGCPGLSLQEIMFIEHFRNYIRPSRIFIVGNALGWSTVALTLVFPEAVTVAIDTDGKAVDWTNDLLTRNRLCAIAVRARSPDDVAKVVDQHLKGPIEFSLIDAHHTNDALIADFAAIHAVSAKNAIHLFHDVINRRMQPGFNRILTNHELRGRIFPRTPSGMALAYRDMNSEFAGYLDCFTGPLAAPTLEASWIRRMRSHVGRVFPEFVKVRQRKFLVAPVERIIAKQLRGKREQQQ